MKMTKAAMIFVLGLVSLLAFFFVGDGCDNVPSMAREDACLKACNTQPLNQLCLTMLQHTAPTGEVTTYAFAAATFARSAYESSVDVADRLLQNPSLPADEGAAYVSCKDRYAQASSLLAGVLDQLTGCSFANARQEYVDAVVSVVSCGNALSAFQNSPLNAMNAADQDKTMVAYDLGALIVGK